MYFQLFTSNQKLANNHPLCPPSRDFGTGEARASELFNGSIGELVNRSIQLSSATRTTKSQMH